MGRSQGQKSDFQEHHARLSAGILHITSFDPHGESPWPYEVAIITPVLQVEILRVTLNT